MTNIERSWQTKERKGTQNECQNKSNCSSSESSVLFTATFAGAVRGTICADIGADANIMGALTLNQLLPAGWTVEVESFTKPRLLNMAAQAPTGNQSQLKCDRTATMDTDVHIRHGDVLKLRRVRWLVSEQKVPETLLGRPVVEALCLDTAQIISAAANKYAWSVDAEELTKTIDEQAHGRVLRVLEGFFHTNDCGPLTEEEGAPPSWCYLGSESDKEWESQLSVRPEEASKCYISTDGKERLEKLLHDNRDIMRVRLKERLQAKALPLRIRLKPESTPVRAKLRRYPPAKINFLQKIQTNY